MTGLSAKLHSFWREGSRAPWSWSDPDDVIEYKLSAEGRREAMKTKRKPRRKLGGVGRGHQDTGVGVEAGSTEKQGITEDARRDHGSKLGDRAN